MLEISYAWMCVWIMDCWRWMIQAGLSSPFPSAFVLWLEGGIHFKTLMCTIGHARCHPVKYRGWLGNTEAFPSSGNWAMQTWGRLGCQGVSVPLRGSKKWWQCEILQQGKDLPWTHIWSHCSFSRSLFPSILMPRQALEDKHYYAPAASATKP